MQTRHHIVLLGRHRPGGGDNRSLVPGKNRSTQLWIEVRLAIGQLVLQMLTRKFQSNELMMVPSPAGSRQRLIRERVITSAAGNIISLGPVTDCTTPFHVQAEFDAARTKARSPIERPVCLEIVPLETDPEAIEVSIQLPPTLRNCTPGTPLCRRVIDGK